MTLENLRQGLNGRLRPGGPRPRIRARRVGWMTTIGGLAAAVVALLSVLAAAPARAQTAPAAAAAPAPPPRADAREMKARGLFARGRYAEALEIYVTLYAETAHPTYIRNIGRCYQNLGDAEKAISTFREYLRQAKALAPPQRAQIEDYIHEMEELRQKHEAEANAAPPAAGRPKPTTAGNEPVAAPPAAHERTTPDLGAGLPPAPAVADARAAPGGSEGAGGPVSGRKVAAIATGAVGLAALGVGAFYGLRALSKRQASDELCSGDPCGSADGVRLNEDAKSAAGLADVALGVGVVAVGVATVLLLTAPKERAPMPAASAARLRLTPALAANGRAATLSLDGAW